MATAPAGHWPSTPWDSIRRAQEASPEARREAVKGLLALYYEPIRGFFARVLGVTDDAASDVAHDLLAKLLERESLEGPAGLLMVRGSAAPVVHESVPTS